MINRIIIGFIKRAIYYFNVFIPKRKNQIFFSSSFEYEDNIAALVSELLKHDGSKKYQIILDGKGLTRFKEENICHVKHKSLKSIVCFLRSRYVIYDNGIYGSKKTKNQTSVNIWHGMPIKKIGNYIEGKEGSYIDTATNVIATSEFYRNIMGYAFGIKSRDVLITNEPRNDFLFDKSDNLYTIGIDNLSYNNQIIWMATYRTSKLANTGNDSHSYEYGVPLLNKNNILVLNSFLAKKKTLLVIKHHSLQNLPIVEDEIKNIRFVTSEDIMKSNEPLYALLPKFDALITDYSSVFINYLILNKPICFAYDDFNVYSNKRGFLFDDLESMMPGFKANNFNQLIEFIDQLSLGIDNFQSERIIANEKFNAYDDDKNSYRLLKQIGILK